MDSKNSKTKTKYLDMANSGQRRQQTDAIATEKSIEKMSYSLIEWAKKPTSLFINDWRLFYGLKESIYYDYMQRYPVFKEAVKIAKDLIQQRILRKLYNKVDSKTMQVMLMGHERYKDNYKEYQNIKNEGQWNPDQWAILMGSKTTKQKQLEDEDE